MPASLEPHARLGARRCLHSRNASPPGAEPSSAGAARHRGRHAFRHPCRNPRDARARDTAGDREPVADGDVGDRHGHGRDAGLGAAGGGRVGRWVLLHRRGYLRRRADRGRAAVRLCDRRRRPQRGRSHRRQWARSRGADRRAAHRADALGAAAARRARLRPRAGARDQPLSARGLLGRAGLSRLCRAAQLPCGFEADARRDDRAAAVRAGQRRGQLGADLRQSGHAGARACRRRDRLGQRAMADARGARRRGLASAAW